MQRQTPENTRRMAMAFALDVARLDGNKPYKAEDIVGFASVIENYLNNGKANASVFRAPFKGTLAELNAARFIPGVKNTTGPICDDRRVRNDTVVIERRRDDGSAGRQVGEYEHTELAPDRPGIVYRLTELYGRQPYSASRSINTTVHPGRRKADKVGTQAPATNPGPKTDPTQNRRHHSRINLTENRRRRSDFDRNFTFALGI